MTQEEWDRLVQEELDRLVQEIRDVRASLGPDLFFGGQRSRAPLVLSLPNIEARYVKFALTGRRSLQLPSVAVRAIVQGHVADVAPRATVKVGPRRAGAASGKDSQPTAQGPIVAVETGKQKDPWAILDLRRAYQIHEISVDSGDDEPALHAWSLRVLLSVDGASWNEVYSHPARVSELIAKTQEALKEEGGTSPEPSIRAITRDLICAAYVGVLQNDVGPRTRDLVVASRKVDSSIREQAMRLVSDELLSEFQLEWTKHGIKRSFRYWSAEECRNYVASANTVVSALQSLAPDVCFGFGTVLGVIRDRGFIPHDDDIDLIIAIPREIAPTIPAALDAITRHLEGYGMRVIGDKFAHRKVRVEGSEKMVDVFAGVYEDGDRIAWFPGPREGRPRAQMFPAIQDEIYGEKCWIPKNPVDYLTWIYGADWRTPKRYFRHQGRARNFTDLQ